MKNLLFILIASSFFYGAEYYGFDFNKPLNNKNCNIKNYTAVCKDKSNLFDIIYLKTNRQKIPINLYLKKEFTSDKYGSSSIAFYNKIKKSLEKKYKLEKEKEFISNKGFYKENFCFGLKMNENMYMCSFNDENNTEIGLMIAKSNRIGDCDVVVIYTPEVQKEKEKEKKNKALDSL